MYVCTYVYTVHLCGTHCGGKHTDVPWPCRSKLCLLASFSVALKSVACHAIVHVHACMCTSHRWNPPCRVEYCMEYWSADVCMHGSQLAVRCVFCRIFLTWMWPLVIRLWPLKSRRTLTDNSNLKVHKYLQQLRHNCSFNSPYRTYVRMYVCTYTFLFVQRHHQFPLPIQCTIWEVKMMPTIWQCPLHKEQQ